HDDLGDIGRVQRQQLLMRAFVEQEVNVGLLSRLPKILSVIQSHLDTNLSIEELVALAGFATQTDRAGVQMLMVPGKFSDAKDYKASFWLPDQYAIETLVAEHFDFGQNTWTIENADSTFLNVAIQDSTGDPSAVEDLVNTLTQAGYRNVQVYKAWPEPLEVTTLVAQQGDIKGAQAIRQFLGFGDVLVESTGSLQSDVTIRLGQDWLEKKAHSGSAAKSF
ncbi:MAG TPA: LCP family protein, partial [Microcoleus sp.]|nr:LCP family protein [Microcoleus sp.]